MGKDLKGKELGRGLSQRPDGRYMGRAQVEGKPIVLYGWKVKELKKELVRAVDDLKRSNLLPEEDGTGITLSEWFEEWYSKYKAPTLKDGGSPAYKRKFLNYYGVRIGSKYLADIRQLHVQTAIADMVESGRSSKSIREATGILQNCIEAAIANGLMRINPVVGTIVPKCEKVERRVLTVEEQRIFLDYLAQNKSWYEELYKFMLLTGLRIGDDDDKIRLNQRKPSKYKGLRRFGPEKNLQRINKFMKERPIFYKNLIQMKENIRFYLRCFYCITKVMILQFNSENRTELARNG